MSGTSGRRKRDKILKKLEKLPLRFSPSQPSPQSTSSQPPSQQLVSQPPVTQPPLTTVTNVPTQSSVSTNSLTGQAIAGASSTKDVTFLENVLERFTEEQRSTLKVSYAQSSNDIDSTLTAALQAAENKKQLCINKQWTLKIGSRTISTREKAEKVVELLERFKRVGDIIASADPIHVGLPWAGVSFILQVAASERQQMDAVLSGIATALSMQRTLDVYLAFFHTLPPSNSATALEIALVETYATILGFLATSLGLLDKSSPSRFWAALLGGGELQQFGSTCLAVRHQVETAASNCDRSLDAHGRAVTQECKGILDLLLGDIDAIKHQTARIELSISLAKLPRASTAAFDSTDEERMPRCLKSTRVELLSDIERWVQDSASAQFFWLQGVAGTGKSTVARTIATLFNDHQILGASFFFKRGHAERGSADLFFTTVAIQLAQKVPGMDGAIAQLLDNELGVYRKGIHTQFRDLILSPLRATRQTRQASDLDLVILIDALDECDDEGDRKGDTKQILECLAQLKGVHGLRLRLIVTSRLEFQVEVGFAALGSEAHDDIVLHELPRTEIERDIRIFIEAEFQELRHTLSQRRHREVLHDGWPGDDVVENLTKRSVPLFIFASTVCSFVADTRFTPQAQLKKVLDDRNPVQLSSTYLLVLQAMIPASADGADVDWDLDAMDNFQKIVGFISCSMQAQSIRTIAALLGLTVDQVEATLNGLHSVLDVTSNLDRPVRPIHLSFIEFLTHPKTGHKFQINERATHEFIAGRCLAVMMQRPGGLQQDICQVRKPGSRRLDAESRVVESHISPMLSYACRYWVHHLALGNVLIDDQHDTLPFLSGWFLHWFEAMAWLGKASEIPRTLRRLFTFRKEDGVSRISEVLAAAYQFARTNQHIADLAPLQLYASALVFASDFSTIKTLFKPRMPLWLPNPPKIEKPWHSERLTLEGHTGQMTAITFSPNDELLGTCSLDGTSRVWDTTDATCLLTFSHDNHEYSPYAISFSPDSSKIAVAYYTTFRMDLHTKVAVIVYTRKGALVRAMQCLGSFVTKQHLAVAFVDDDGKDDDAIALAVANPTHVQAWRSVKGSDILIRAWTSQFPYQERQYPINVCISQDASLLCCSPVLDERDDGVSSISTLNLKTRAVTSRHGQYEGLGGMVFCGTTLVCEMIRKEREPGDPLMSLMTFELGNPGESTHLLDYDGFWLNFSLANAKHRVAFNTISNYTVHIETIPISKKVGQSQAPHERRVAVAPRGDLVADWNNGHLIILDTHGLVTQIFDRQESFDETQCLIISPDSRFVALGHEKGVTVWNLETRKRSQYSEIQDLFALAFSNNNEMLASASGFDISLWDLESKQMMLTTRLDDGCCRLKFSTDGDYLITDRRRLHIATATWTTLDQMDPSLSDKEVILSDEFSGLGWVRFAEEDLFWIPVEYRARDGESDARGGTVALGQEDGSVMILTFDLSVL